MYPVSFEADYVEPRNRLTTFFRIFLAIPHFILGWFYGVAASVAAVIAWFAIVFIGRYPEGIYNFLAGFARFYTRLLGYVSLLTDQYPPFSGSADDTYPVRVHIGDPKAEYDRLKTGLRFILAIPILILRYVLQLLVGWGALAAWFVIVITGHQLRGLQQVMVLGSSYIARSDAYLFLLTESYPPFSDDMRAAIEAGEGQTARTATALGADPAPPLAPQA